MPWKIGEGQRADFSLLNCQGCVKEPSFWHELSGMCHKTAKAESGDGTTSQPPREATSTKQRSGEA
jgi:hypothetical protein